MICSFAILACAFDRKGVILASGRARDKARVDLYGHDIRVTAFPVRHGLRHAFGFRFETPDKIVVMSGDTAPTPSLVEHCAGCDVLIHETYSQATYEKVSRK